MATILKNLHNVITLSVIIQFGQNLYIYCISLSLGLLIQNSTFKSRQFNMSKAIEIQVQRNLPAFRDVFLADSIRKQRGTWFADDP